MLAKVLPVTELPTHVYDVVEGTEKLGFGDLRHVRVEHSLRCGGCARARQFVAETERLLRQQIASSGWKWDGRLQEWECPACWMAYELSVMQAARGNT